MLTEHDARRLVLAEIDDLRGHVTYDLQILRVHEDRPKLLQGSVCSFGVPGRERGEQAGDLLARAEMPEPLPRDLVIPEPVLDLPRDRAGRAAEKMTRGGAS